MHAPLITQCTWCCTPLDPTTCNSNAKHGGLYLCTPPQCVVSRPIAQRPSAPHRLPTQHVLHGHRLVPKTRSTEHVHQETRLLVGHQSPTKGVRRPDPSVNTDHQRHCTVVAWELMGHSNPHPNSNPNSDPNLLDRISGGVTYQRCSTSFTATIGFHSRTAARGRTCDGKFGFRRNLMGGKVTVDECRVRA